MDQLGHEYFELLKHVPLRPFETEDEYLEADEFCEVLKHDLLAGNLSDDEVAYLEVLDLLLFDFEDGLIDADELEEVDFEQLDFDGDDADVYEPVIAEEISDVDHLTAELGSLLNEKKETMQEWDFVALCHSFSTVISSKLAELELG